MGPFGVVIATLNAGGDAGVAAEVTDPAGHIERTYSDPEGRAVRTIEDFTDGVVTGTSNKTTDSTYNSAGQTGLTAYQTGGGGQTTAYIYGVSQSSGSNIDSSDIVGQTRFPDPTTGLASSSQQETTTVNALGQTLTSTDRNGNVHTLSYDVVGRVVSDAVTTLGTGVDGSVRRIETAYDGQGNPYLITSYSAASGGSIVNQVQRAYNGLGQMTAEWQAHSGAVNTSTSPEVQYAFAEMPSGADQSRLTSMTYPDGYVLTYNYSSGLNDSISRLSSLSDTSGTLESYSYMGLGTVVVRSHPQPAVDQTYVGTPGDAGDQYAGLDRFGRVVDQLWKNTSTSTTTDENLYGYDLLGNRLYRDNTVNTGFGELYTYDALNQLATFQRGTLNSGKTGITGTVARSQNFTTDGVGNFTNVTTNGTAQTRTANAQNQITSISGATTPTYDNNGNMTGDETGRTFVYDAWNRLVTVKNSGGTTLETFTYDGLNRRITQTASGTTTDLFYSDQGQVLEEMQSGSATARYVWSPVYVNALVLRDRATGSPGTLNERLWVQQDANWNVTALVNGSGVVVERYAYDPYGVVTIYDASYTVRGSSSYAANYLFQGMRYDALSGLYASNGIRLLSPTLERWNELDPIQFAAGDVNLSAFVFNNSIRNIDPSGEALPAILLIGAVLISGATIVSSDPVTTAIGERFPNTLAGPSNDWYGRFANRLDRTTFNKFLETGTILGAQRSKWKYVNGEWRKYIKLGAPGSTWHVSRWQKLSFLQGTPGRWIGRVFTGAILIEGAWDAAMILEAGIYASWPGYREHFPNGPARTIRNEIVSSARFLYEWHLDGPVPAIMNWKGGDSVKSIANGIEAAANIYMWSLDGPASVILNLK
jgi:RHS repeat-associated protein